MEEKTQKNVTMIIGSCLIILFIIGAVKWSMSVPSKTIKSNFINQTDIVCIERIKCNLQNFSMKGLNNTDPILNQIGANYSISIEPPKNTCVFIGFDEFMRYNQLKCDLGRHEILRCPNQGLNISACKRIILNEDDPLVKPTFITTSV